MLWCFLGTDQFLFLLYCGRDNYSIHLKLRKLFCCVLRWEFKLNGVFFFLDELGTAAICLSMYSLDLKVNTEGVNGYSNNCAFGCWKDFFYLAIRLNSACN